MASQSYFRVLWHHDHNDEPVDLWSEIDEQRYETRKLEIFVDGRVGWAGPGEGAFDSMLGDQPAPPVEEINKDSGFAAKAVSQDAFEAMWSRRFDRITERPKF